MTRFPHALPLPAGLRWRVSPFDPEEEEAATALPPGPEAAKPPGLEFAPLPAADLGGLPDGMSPIETPPARDPKAGEAVRRQAAEVAPQPAAAAPGLPPIRYVQPGSVPLDPDGTGDVSLVRLEHYDTEAERDFASKVVPIPSDALATATGYINGLRGRGYSLQQLENAVADSFFRITGRPLSNLKAVARAIHAGGSVRNGIEYDPPSADRAAIAEERARIRKIAEMDVSADRGGKDWERGRALGNSTMKGLTLNGSDHVIAGMKTLTGDKSYDDNLAYQRAISAYDGRHHKAAQFIGEFVIPALVTRKPGSLASGAVFKSGIGKAAAGAYRATRLDRLSPALRETAKEAAKGATAAFLEKDGRFEDRLKAAAHDGLGAAAAHRAVVGLDPTGGAPGAAFRTPSPAQQTRIDAAIAAERQGVHLPGHVAGGPARRAAAGAIEATQGGAPVIQAGTDRMIDDVAARVSDQARTIAPPPAPGRAGAAPLQTGRSMLARHDSHADGVFARIGGRSGERRYRVEAQGLDRLAGGDGRVGSILAETGARLAADGVAIAEVPRIRRELGRRLSREGGLAPAQAGALADQVMERIHPEIAAGLSASGNRPALADYRRSTARLRKEEKGLDIVRHYVGDGARTAAQLIELVNRDSREHAMQLASLFARLPKARADELRAGIVAPLGGEGRFSLPTFLENWERLGGARAYLLGADRVRDLDALAAIARLAVKTNRVTRSAPGAAAARSDGAAAAERLAGAGGWADARQAAIAVAASAMAEGQGAALIASTGLARRLARTPIDGKAAIRYWSSAWVAAAARLDPAIAADLISLKSKILSVLKDEAPGEEARRRRRDAGR